MSYEFVKTLFLSNRNYFSCSTKTQCSYQYKNAEMMVQKATKKNHTKLEEFVQYELAGIGHLWIKLVCICSQQFSTQISYFIAIVQIIVLVLSHWISVVL